jgi:hypothetical protein
MHTRQRCQTTIVHVATDRYESMCITAHLAGHALNINIAYGRHLFGAVVAMIV